MSQQIEGGNKTFTATEALEAYRNVKLTTSSGTAVEYADSGDASIGVTQHAAAAGAQVAVRLRTAEGTRKMTASASITAGATVYPANDGKVSSSSAGSALGRAAEAASGNGSIIEVIQDPILSTTAATVSVTDAGGFTAETDVEAALAEIYQHLKSAQGSVGVPLGAITQEDGTALLKQATTVAGYAQLANKETVINIPVDCTAGEALGFSVALPRDIDITEDLFVDVLVGKAADNDTLTLDCEVFPVGAGDVANADIQDTAAQAIVAAGTVLSFTCGADGLIAVPSAVSVVLTLGGTNDGDAVYIYAVWLRYTRRILTS